MNIINADEMIEDLTAMKKFGYDAIAIDGMVKSLKERSFEGSVPVVQAKWVRETEDGVYWYVCSECREVIPKDKYWHDMFSAYCPHCGAKMQDIDLEEE